MRDPARIDTVLATLRALWETSPDLRLGQLIVIAAAPREPVPEIFHIEDDVLLENLEQHLRREQPSRP
ncbi:MAG: hypothetical protein ACN6RG_05695 [Stenotrophomonas sp.]